MALRNVGKVDHAIAYFWNTENLERAQRKLEEALGVIDFHEVPDPSPLNLLILLSWEWGIELAAPRGELPQDNDFYQALKQRGEGWQMVVFGVANLDDADMRIKSAGGNILGRYDVSKNHPEMNSVVETILDGLPLPIMVGVFEPKGQS